MRLLALCGIAAPLVVTSATILAAAARPDYSHLHQFISELGATGTANALLMNYVGFVPTGLLLVCLAVSVRVRLPRTRLATAAGVLLGIFGVGIVTSLDTRSFAGLWQRAFLAVAFLWCAVIGWYLYSSDHTERSLYPPEG